MGTISSFDTIETSRFFRTKKKLKPKKLYTARNQK